MSMDRNEDKKEIEEKHNRKLVCLIRQLNSVERMISSKTDESQKRQRYWIYRTLSNRQ